MKTLTLLSLASLAISVAIPEILSASTEKNLLEKRILDPEMQYLRNGLAYKSTDSWEDDTEDEAARTIKNVPEVEGVLSKENLDRLDSEISDMFMTLNNEGKLDVPRYVELESELDAMATKASVMESTISDTDAAQLRRMSRLYHSIDGRVRRSCKDKKNATEYCSALYTENYIEQARGFKNLFSFIWDRLSSNPVQSARLFPRFIGIFKEKAVKFEAFGKIPTNFWIAGIKEDAVSESQAAVQIFEKLEKLLKEHNLV